MLFPCAACSAGLAETDAGTHLYLHEESNPLVTQVVRIESEPAASS